jgi:hypothetical protein
VHVGTGEDPLNQRILYVLGVALPRLNFYSTAAFVTKPLPAMLHNGANYVPLNLETERPHAQAMTYMNVLLDLYHQLCFAWQHSTVSVWSLCKPAFSVATPNTNQRGKPTPNYANTTSFSKYKLQDPASIR